MKTLRVLVACEFSGIVRYAFAAQGCDAWSCDLLPSERPGKHIQGDAIAAIKAGCPTDGKPWDLVICHPPCTYLCNSGVRWLWKPIFDERGTLINKVRDMNRWDAMQAACDFFSDCWLACGDVPRCFENPVMHCHAATRIAFRNAYVKPQIVQPWQHGHPETKATGLYLAGLPQLRASRVVWAEMQALPKKQRSRCHYASPGPDRWRERSRTLPGVAAAMAQQWTQYLLS